MNSQSIRFLNGQEVIDLFQGQEQTILDRVARAYQTHDRGQSHVPHSSFLRFPNLEKERIIALPAYLGGDFDVAGLKWIASFPGNLARNMERASAVLILNSTETGHVKALMESSVISAKRTAASAALAARTLTNGAPRSHLRVLGCGLINFETVRFTLVALGTIRELTIYDLSRERAEQFARKCQELAPHLQIHIAGDLSSLLDGADLVAIATTAVTPYIDDLSMCSEECVILHTSLRDLLPDVILSADNIADDVDHVLRARTSVDLAQEQVGHHDFMRGSIGQILNGTLSPRTDKLTRVIYNPFGLGALDMALGNLAYELAETAGVGTVLDSFLPAPWTARQEQSLFALDA